jgi:FMN phosphatase YigB (HAD superfamily)
MKFVALDIGNVLCHVDFSNLLRDLSETLNITTQDALYFINRSQKLHDLGLTVMKDELTDHLKIKSQVTINKLLTSWNNVVKPDLRVLNMYNKMIGEDNLQVALLSNIGIEHAALMEEVLSHNGFFKNAIRHFSCEVGARKPTALYYQSFLMSHPEFQGCVYVDDVVDNLVAGQKFGFKPYHFALDTMNIDEEFPEIEKLILGS